MLSRFERARVIDTGDYEIPSTAVAGAVERYPWVELVQRHDELPAGYPERQGTGSQRFSVDRAAVGQVDAPQFGDVVDGVFEITEQTKVIKGTDRSVDQSKLKIVEWRRVEAKAASSRSATGNA